MIQLAHCRKLFKHPANLPVDVLAAGILAAEFVANRLLVAVFPDAADGYLIADIQVAMVEGMLRQPVGR